MARTIRNHKIDSASARARLKRQRSVYWVPLSPSLAMGYRKQKVGGVWVAKVTKPCRREKTIGIADDTSDADGIDILTYSEAQVLTRQFAINAAKPLPSRSSPITVGEAVDDYLDWAEAESKKSFQAMKYDAEAFIRPEFGKVEINAIAAADIRNWRNKLGALPPRIRTRRGEQQRHKSTTQTFDEQRRAKLSANRKLTLLKSILNHAWRENDEVENDTAWRKVQLFPNVRAARQHYLTTDECQRLISASAKDFAFLVEGALHTGCRYSELCRMRVENFDPENASVLVETSKNGKSRHVVLTDTGCQFFSQMVSGLNRSDSIFKKTTGEPWGRSEQIFRVKAAVTAAKIDKPATFHTLRHTYCSHLIMNGAPLAVVAKNAGHSDTRMVEKHYGHLSRDYVSQEIRAKALTLITTESNNERKDIQATG